MDGKDWTKKVGSFKERIKKERELEKYNEWKRRDMENSPPPIPKDAGETPPPIPKDARKASAREGLAKAVKELEGGWIGSKDTPAYKKAMEAKEYLNDGESGIKQRYDKAMETPNKIKSTAKGIGAGLAAMAVGELVSKTPDLQLTIHEAGKGSDELPEDEKKKKSFINMLHKTAKGK